MLINMSEERWLWYQQEVQRLKEIDSRTSDRVRATYTIKK
tara:strand:- start:7094 stop:7213 length:120 start_codon:yes stop_codon:yes gene_type:complete